MRQSIIVEPKISKIVEREIPNVRTNEVLVKVKACGICASELHGGWIGGGNYPMERGHEVAGEVVKVGSSVTSVQKGMRVAGLFLKGFAEYTVTTEDKVVTIPDGIDYDIAAALSEPLSCVISSTRRTPVELGDSVVVVGLGFMGILKLQTLALKGASRIIAVDVRKEALEIAQQYGADEVYHPADLPEKYKLNSWDKLEGDYGVDIAIEASGTQPGLTLAVQLPKAHGCLNILGFHQGGPRSVDVELLNWKAVTIINGHERRFDYQMDCLRRGLDIIAEGKIDANSLVTNRYGLEDVDEAFKALLNKPEGFIKSVVIID